MDREELAKRYFDAYLRKDVSGMLKLLHPRATYYDAFWGDVCGGADLAKYLEVAFAEDTHWYHQDGNVINTPEGVIIRYSAYAADALDDSEALYSGAEVLEIEDGMIISISDHYCDPDPAELIEMSALAAKPHGHLPVSPLGLSAKMSGQIKKRLAKLADDARIFLDPKLTVTQLAEHAHCTVMQLFHVLEEEKGVTYLEFVNECRVRYATSILVDADAKNIRMDNVAEQAGFSSVDDFRTAFAKIFGDGPEAYIERIGHISASN